MTALPLCGQRWDWSTRCLYSVDWARSPKKFISNSYLSVAARTLAGEDPSLRYTGMLLGRQDFKTFLTKSIYLRYLPCIKEVGLPSSAGCPVSRNVSDEECLPLASVSKGGTVRVTFTPTRNTLRRVPLMTEIVTLADKQPRQRAAGHVLFCLLVAYRPSNILVYLRDGSAQTILRAATLR